MLYIYCLLFFLCMSFLAFCLYGLDKRKARKGKFRIRESVLLGFSFFGGALGGSLGMAFFRHKTKHWYFRVVNLLGLLWQAALVVFLAVKGYQL